MLFVRPIRHHRQFFSYSLDVIDGVCFAINQFSLPQGGGVGVWGELNRISGEMIAPERDTGTDTFVHKGLNI